MTKWSSPSDSQGRRIALHAVLPDLMPLEQVPDWDQRLKRTDAFWDRQIIDRPVVSITIPRRDLVVPWPARKIHASLRERWMDAEYAAGWAYATVMNTEYLGDALPIACPNLGPEVFSSFFGAELEFSETTSWSIPNLERWADADRLKFSEESQYWKKINELTDAFLAIGRGRFYTGVTDLHPGGDAIVAFRDPMDMNIDMLESPGEIKKLLRRINETYFKVFDFYHGKLKAARQAVTNWTRIASTRKHYVPSNDFSCMISTAMFNDVFLPGIIEECRHLEVSIYHLDGPGALRHLDSLLEINELNAIQWVCGAGNGPTLKWLDLYRQIQAAGKGIQVLGLKPFELDELMRCLRPEGLWLDMEGVTSPEEAEAIIGKVSRWR